MKERTEKEYQYREFLISRIESFCGSMKSIPYSEIDTKDLCKLLGAITFIVDDCTARTRQLFLLEEISTHRMWKEARERYEQ